MREKRNKKKEREKNKKNNDALHHALTDMMSTQGHQ